MPRFLLIALTLALQGCAAEAVSACGGGAIARAQAKVREAALARDAVARGGSLYAYAKVPPPPGTTLARDLVAAEKRLAAAREHLEAASAQASTVCDAMAASEDGLPV